jgi:hypothetical protein
MTSVLDQIEVICDFINSPRKQHLLISQMADWNKLCSSLDVVGDTELAIESFLKTIQPKSDGEMYLVIYGILQVLFVQQDAVQHIAESLAIHYTPDPLLAEIREIRNASIGHPTKRGSGKGSESNFISRPTMSSTGFQLMTTYADRVQPQFTYIDIPKLIQTQRDKLSQLLSTLIQTLREEEMNHRIAFQDEKLTDIFPHTLDYYCEKIYESIRGNMPKTFGSGMVDLINNHLTEFKGALDRRDLFQALDSVKYLFDELSYPLEKLKKYFTDAANPTFNDKDALIFIFFIRRHLEGLRSIAKEIDAKYAAEP